MASYQTAHPRSEPLDIHLLVATVRDLQEEIEGLGETVAFDTKHIYAWVKENNPRAYVKDRYDPDREVAGDPDCRLGVKRSTNLEQSDGSTKEKFDAWYVYDDMARHGGIAAVPLNQHGHPTFTRDTDGVPLCPKGLRMQPKFQFNHTNGYKAQRYCCPLLYPERTGEDCDHEQFKKGKGCVKDINIEAGGIMPITLDRTGPLYKVVYNQRTCCERINSQAKELGIERPKVKTSLVRATDKKSLSCLRTIKDNNRDILQPCQPQQRTPCSSLCKHTIFHQLFVRENRVTSPLPLLEYSSREPLLFRRSFQQVSRSD